MAITPVAYAVFPTVATVLAAVLAVLAWDRRPARGATAFAVAMGGIGIWSLAYLLDLLTFDVATKVFYAQLSYVGIVIFPAAWLLFALAYAGEASLVNRRTVALLAVEPVVVLGLVSTYGSHDLFWASIDSVVRDGVRLLEYTYGPAFWAHTGYTYLLVLAGFAVLIEGAGRSPGYTRRQVGGLLLAAVPPILGNALYLFEVGPAPPGVDLTTVGFAVGGIPAFVVLFRYGLLELPAAAHERLFETIEDPIFLLDAQHRVIRCNPAAERLVNVPGTAIQGQPLPDVLPGGSDLFSPGDDRAYRDQIRLEVGGVERQYAVSLSSLFYTQQDVMGRMIMLRPPDGEPAPD